MVAGVNEAIETIAAIATPPGQGGIGIIRVSGPQALVIADEIADATPRIGHAQYSAFRAKDQQIIDQGVLLCFAAPHSFTGENVVEFQIHGGQYVLAALLNELCQSYRVRLARPGEFSERAFHNGKLDLVQAEAIADLIAAGSSAAARAAQRSLNGVFSARCHALHDGLLDLRMRLESAIDFPEEDIDFLSDPELLERWQALHVEHAQLLAQASHGVVLNQGLTIVLAGAPNAGKSSILNSLSKREAAIVTPLPGTTRDVLSERIQLNGVPATLIDTAGLRDSDDPIEQEGVRRARQAAATADYLLHVQAPDIVNDRAPPTQARIIEVWNKCDLVDHPAGWMDSSHSAIRVSAQTGDGLDLLVDELAGQLSIGGGDFSARQRHVDALRQFGEHLAKAGQHLKAGCGELSAEELRLAQQRLGEITGQVHSDELLGRIFSSFCIGK